MARPLRLLSHTSVRLGFAGILLIVVVLVWVEARRLSGLYWYDVEADQNYSLTDARSMPVVLRPDGFDWPSAAGETSTALLAVDVRASLRGRWSEPSVEIRLDDGPPRVQHLERGAAGRRYLNLGRVPNGISSVGLRPNHLRFDDASAELLLFESAPVDSGVVLVLATHPDDAEIAAFGLYSTTDAWVVTVSAGNNVDARMAHLLRDPAARSRLKGELRVFDSVTVPRWGGVPAERALNLGYFNQSLAALYREPRGVVADPVLGSADIEQFRSVGASEALRDRDARSTWQSLVADLVAVVEFVRPATIVTPHPALDASPDHKLTTVALTEALQTAGATDVQLLLYTNHATGSEYFPFGPAESVVSLPPWTANPLRVDGVVSLALDEDLRLRKLYALEAQHDLRPSPRVVGTSPLSRIGATVGRGLSDVLRDPTDTYSYMRRGPRPNELFLTLRAADAQVLLDDVRAFLDDARAGRIRGGGY